LLHFFVKKKVERIKTNTNMQYSLSPELIEKLTYFFEEHSPQELNTNLRRILLDYLRIELRSAVPLFTEELLSSLYDLFELLDLAAEETDKWHNSETQPAGSS
jgi:hypothetical protein